VPSWLPRRAPKAATSALLPGMLILKIPTPAPRPLEKATQAALSSSSPTTTRTDCDAVSLSTPGLTRTPTRGPRDSTAARRSSWPSHHTPAYRPISAQRNARPTLLYARRRITTRPLTGDYLQPASARITYPRGNQRARGAKLTRSRPALRSPSPLPPSFQGDTIRLTVEGMAEEVKEAGPGDYSSAEDLHNLNIGWREYNNDNNTFRRTNSNSAYSPNLATLGTNRAQEEIVRALKILLSRQESQDADKKRLNEWRVIAIAVDRILFWIFFFVTTISSLVFLVILPVVKRSEYVRNT
ncbi:putative ligand-gated ion channel subunit, partial [Penaeus vannamei]